MPGLDSLPLWSWRIGVILVVAPVNWKRVLNPVRGRSNARKTSIGTRIEKCPLTHGPQRVWPDFGFDFRAAEAEDLARVPR